MQSKRRAMEAYTDTLNKSSWENLQEAYPEIAEGLEEAIGAGNTPAQVYSETLKSGHSRQLAKWCRSAATYLKKVLDDERDSA